LNALLRKIITCLWLLLCCLYDLAAADYPVKYLGIEHGLSNNAVTSIYQDKKGFMWFGTYDGLNHYDGYNFQVYRNRVGDSSSLLGNAVYTIAGDSRDNLWVGGQKGACVLDSLRKNFTSLKFISADTKREEWLRDDIHNIMITRNDMVLIGTNHRGLIVFDKNTYSGRQIAIPAEPGANYDATAIEMDPSGNIIWVFVQQQGLFVFNLSTKKLSLLNSDIKEGNCLRRASEGNLWLGNERGLFEYNVHTNQYSSNRISTTSKIVHLKEDRNGLLWIASEMETVCW
jgi:ligand-binding sensor domain-containing protein